MLPSLAVLGLPAASGVAPGDERSPPLDVTLVGVTLVLLSFPFELPPVLPSLPLESPPVSPSPVLTLGVSAAAARAVAEPSPPDSESALLCPPSRPVLRLFAVSLPLVRAGADEATMLPLPLEVLV